jgi:hypothetical protein
VASEHLVFNAGQRLAQWLDLLLRQIDEAASVAAQEGATSSGKRAKREGPKLSI